MSSQAELLVVEEEAVEPTLRSWEDLRQELPAGIEIIKIQEIPSGLRCLPRWARYHIRLGETADRLDLERRVEEFLSRANYPIKRHGRARHPDRTIDARRSVSRLQPDRQGILCTIDIQPEGTVRIDELLSALGINVAQALDIERLAVGYPPELMQEN